MPVMDGLTATRLIRKSQMRAVAGGAAGDPVMISASQPHAYALKIIALTAGNEANL